MGSASSKLKKKLAKGDEYSALILIETNKDLQRKFNPNSSYGDHYNHDTPLHIAARHAMPRALRLFLLEYGGNPNKKNGLNESALHCACQLADGCNAKNVAAHEQCVDMLVDWQGDKLEDGTCEKLDIAAQDKAGNTALHYAAQSGFINCVKRLVDLGAPLFTENDARQTPCDLAERASITTVAQYLESKMVFFVNEDAVESTESTEGEGSAGPEEPYQALKPQQLQEAKDTLIVETSDMLRVPLFTAEVLLRHHEWDKEVLLEAWISNPVTCCEKSGVVPPANLNDTVTDDNRDHELNILNTSSSHQDFQPSICEICLDDIADPAKQVPMVCKHRFCQNCWKDYLNIKIKEGDAHNIVCPAVDCNILVPVEFIETAVSSTMAKRYLHFDIKAFVASNPRIVWCPHPGCGQAIQNPSRNRSASVTSRSSQLSMLQYQPLEAHCESGHSFCWQCQGEPHDPTSCDDYKRWLEKIVQMKKDEFKDVTKKSELAANTFWMLSNSKKCPNCKSPIEKNEGCNHMRCSKCKHDFCWVCLEPWKYHNSTTGGFFRCTRFEVVEKVDEQHKSEVTDASDRHKALQELNRFVHYYTRYENHKHSLELEEPLLEKTKQKMAQLVNTHTLKSNKQSVAMDTMSRLAAARFIDEAISVLIKARRMLQFCYVYGYYLQGSSMKRMVFELLQTELEEKTEYLSEIVARPYLKTPKTEIVKITKQVADKTEEFFKSIANGLLPQDLPSQSDGAGSGGSRSPWLVTPGPSTSADWLSDTDDSGDEPINRQDVCAAANCKKLKLRHSGAPDSHHDYCSLKCLKSDYITRSKKKAKHQSKEQQLDLLQALEMSRLQLLHDMDSINTGSSSDVSVEEDVSLRRRLGINNTELPADPILEHVLRLSQSAYAEEQDEDLTLAIRMSLQSADAQQRMPAERVQDRTNRTDSHSESLNSSEAASHDGAGATGDMDEVYRNRLVELDNAIAELLDGEPIRDNDTLRRTESDRRNSGRSTEGDSVSRLRPIRRTRSERREGTRRQSKNL